VNPTSYTVENAVTLLAATRDGYGFAGWHDNAGLTGDPVATIPAGSTGDKAFYAKWELPFTITYVLNGGNNAPENPETYIGSNAVTLEPATRDGYGFAGWYDNEGLTGDAIDGIPAGSAGNKTFYAKWTIDSYNQSIVFVINLADPAGSAFNDSAFDLAKPDETKTITISGSDNDASAQWSVGLAPIATGGSVTLSAANLSLGTHSLRVTAEYGGVRYSKELTFTVH
jgi:uncharacterized repeat protein (TIGR02543 family)